jgi:hypothetical protein
VTDAAEAQANSNKFAVNCNQGELNKVGPSFDRYRENAVDCNLRKIIASVQLICAGGLKDQNFMSHPDFVGQNPGRGRPLAITLWKSRFDAPENCQLGCLSAAQGFSSSLSSSQWTVSPPVCSQLQMGQVPRRCDV